MSAVHLRRLQPDDWELSREVRLAALAESPSAFGSTFAREQMFSEQIWRDRLKTNCCVVAFDSEPRRGTPQPVGVAAGYVGEQGAELVSMWVNPVARGSGAADELIGEVVRWATAEGHVTLSLWVVEGNHRAESVYVRNGFLRTGRKQPVRNGKTGVEIEMLALLAQPS